MVRHRRVQVNFLSNLQRERGFGPPTRHRLVRLHCALWVLMLGAVPCPAQLALGPPPQEALPLATLPEDARTVLTSFGQFYSGLTSFTVNTHSEVHHVVGEKVTDFAVDFSGAMRRPGCFAMNLTGEKRGAEVICDGTTLSINIPQNRAYTRLPAPANMAVVGRAGDLGLSGTMAYPHIMPALLSDAPEQALLGEGSAPKYVGLEQTGATSEHHFRFEVEGVPTDFWITAGETPALTRYREDYSSMLRTTLKSEPSAQVEMFLTFEFRDWSFNPDIPDSRFEFTPPAESRSCRTLHDALTTREEPASPLIGKEAPPLVLDLLDGGQLDLASHKGGQIVVLDFWATWCVQCGTSLPAITSMLQEYEGRNVVFYGVNYREDPASIGAYLNAQHLKMTVALDVRGEVKDAFYITGFPETVVVDKNGIVLAHHVGYGATTLLELQLEIEGALADRPVSPATAKTE